jgi:hypothetical protein
LISSAVLDIKAFVLQQHRDHHDAISNESRRSFERSSAAAVAGEPRSR